MAGFRREGRYRSLFGREVTPAQIRDGVAAGWTGWLVYLDEVEYPLPLRVEAARTALGLYRRIDDSTPAGQIRRARAIDRLGELLAREAGYAAADEKSVELHEAAQVFSEGREILAVLDRAGTLPAASRVYLTGLTDDLAGVNKRLAGLPATTQ